MRQSQLFSKTQKQTPKDEVSLNAKLLIRGGFVDKLMAGVYSLLPLGLRVYKNIEQIIREEMNAVGGQELCLPALQPKDNWQKTDRWGNFDALIYVGLDQDRNMVLGPTHEEIIAPLAKKMISSYKDLPRYVYQFQNKFRNEKRAKSGLLRGREFAMKDLYSFHADEADLNNYYEQAKAAYFKIFTRCGIADLTYLTYATGGAFSKYSHEFQAITDAGEDWIYICDKCRIAVNKTILSDQKNQCPECKSTKLRAAKGVEIGNIFKLGIKFSQPFDLSYVDKNGKKKLVYMGCYGIGLTRLMGTIVEVSHDDKGIIWPAIVAPYKYHLLVLGEDKKVVSAADNLYKNMTRQNIEVLYDDRNLAAGEKFAEADLIGCPDRLVISEKTLASQAVELKKRESNKVELIKINDIATN